MSLTPSSEFRQMDGATSNKCFLPLQSVLEASIRIRGGNCYNNPQLKKDALIRAGNLPRCLPCSAEAFQMSL
ncbi:hypothetical protein F442_07503 [Phytophthora nicotianae P10297]|uniref:Uncharacterized protein n=1 Tax=Phytophthora nicotianae P10297 TaxID=1317064 RepID=W2ZFV5_PHYNI|nr:hypothetical protein F442_07503 [Phytophthora nicotianae P10297]